MSRKYVILPAIAIGLIAPSWAGTVYTREEAVKIALEKSTEIQSAQEDLVSTTSQVDGGYGLAYPSIDLNATVTRIFGLPDVDMKDLSLANELVAKGKEMGLEVTLSLQHLVLHFLKVFQHFAHVHRGLLICFYNLGEN